MKKVVSLLIAVSILAGCILTGCSSYKDPVKDIKTTTSEDKYRNVYEIFVNSFCDSNDDGIGDLQGIISQLDYLNDGNPDTDTDLGIDAIWLTPIMPSLSYHKYDVMDYYNIDEAFGTLDDFDELVSECQKRGIEIIMDMVLNHCSKFHPWFEQACEEVADGNLNGYAKYFQIEKFEGGPVNESAYTHIAGNYWCESNFSSYMPEWDLSSDATRDEFLKIAKFWIDRGVGGFRLDAVKYFTNSTTDGAEFLKWYYNACKEYKEDIYMVGENWTIPGEIYDIYDSGIDSQFCFQYATTSGSILNAVRTEENEKLADKIKNYNENISERNENAINAMFLSNHDMIRSGNSIGSKGVSFEKMAASVYMLLPGNSYIYYGEEIGMTAPATSGDENFRTPMIWDSESPSNINVNGQNIASDPQCGGVKQQQEDEYSLLNFYKRIIKIKNQNPEIARGKITSSEDFEDANILAYYVEYNDSKLMIIHNLSSTEEKNLTITSEMIENPQIRADLTAALSKENNKHISLDGDNLYMPEQSTVILKTK
ncbi:MAG: alpha amylase [Ruminococcus sp.]|nr:alpha amylase [Ruminococcus sp.]